MKIDQTEINRINLQMEKDKIQGNRVVIFHICSLGQIQFIAPIHQEMLRRNLSVSCWLSCDYRLKEKAEGLDIPFSRYLTGSIAERMLHADIFLQTEIYGRGPRNALRIFIGHGQPNKWTNWSEENLKAFDLYFLYGELERSMFEVIMQSQPESTRHIKLFNIGYPKLDDQIQGKYNREEVLEKLGLDPRRKTVIYAPAWDPGGALRTLGTLVPQLLLKSGEINVIVKLHPASLEPPYSPTYQFYTGGVDWLSVFSALEVNPRFKYVNDYLINPLLAASDLLVTDFSGAALEFMCLDRPVVYIHCPEFYEKTLVQWGNDPDVSLHDERFNAGRNAGLVAYRPEKLLSAVRRSLADPTELSDRRRRLVSKFIYNPGYGSRATVDKVLELLDIRPAASLHTV